MQIEQRFRDTLAARISELGDLPAQLPTAIAATLKAVLDVDGVSFSVVKNELRTPLGASDPPAALAESLQFTAGDGPCLEAVRDDMLIDAPASILAVRWPVLHDLWQEQTPFCSAASVPMRLSNHVRGAVNLFFAHEHGGRDVDVVDTHLATQLGALTLEDWAGRAPGQTSALLSGPLATLRGQVWVAMGMIMEAGGVTGPDAIDLLRGWAYHRHLTLDDAAEQVVSGDVETTSVLD